MYADTPDYISMSKQTKYKGWVIFNQVGGRVHFQRIAIKNSDPPYLIKIKSATPPIGGEKKV